MVASEYFRRRKKQTKHFDVISHLFSLLLYRFSGRNKNEKKLALFFLPTKRVFFSQTLVKYRHKTTNKRASGEKAFQGCGGGEFPRSQCITTRGRARPLSRQKRWPYMFVPTGIDGRTFLLDLLRLWRGRVSEGPLKKLYLNLPRPPRPERCFASCVRAQAFSPSIRKYRYACGNVRTPKQLCEFCPFLRGCRSPVWFLAFSGNAIGQNTMCRRNRWAVRSEQTLECAFYYSCH